jgi:hypothetical protein
MSDIPTGADANNPGMIYTESRAVTLYGQHILAEINER